MDDRVADLERELEDQRLETQTLLHGAWEEIRALRDALVDSERRREEAVIDLEMPDYLQENTRLWKELIVISKLGDSKASQHAKRVINGA